MSAGLAMLFGVGVYLFGVLIGIAIARKPGMEP